MTTATQPTLDTRYLPVEAIHPNPENPRHDLGDLGDLAADIAAHGVLQPVVVHPHPDIDGEFMLIAGHRRRAAAELAGVTDVPAVVRDTPDEVTLLEMMLAENLQRAGLDPIDEALALAKVKASGKYRRLADIAQAVHRSQQWVAGRLALVAKLPEECWPAIRSGDVGLGEAVAVASLPAGVDAAERRRLLLDVPAGQRGHEIGRAARNAEKERRRKKLVAEYGELHQGLPPWNVGWGAVRLGDAACELNVPGPMHTTCPGHWATWNGVSDAPAMWCTRPELHTVSEFVAPGPDDDQDLLDVWAALDDWPALAAAGAEPVDRTWDDELSDLHDRCPHHQLVNTPWAAVPVCTRREVHDPDHPDHITLADLEQSATRAPAEAPTGSGARHSSGPRSRPAPPWTPSERLVDELRTRLSDQLDGIDKPVRDLLAELVFPGWVYDERDGGVVDAIVSNLDDFWSTIRHPSTIREDTRPLVPALLWLLRAATDVGEHIPTLDELSIRLENITRGDVVVGEDGGS